MAVINKGHFAMPRRALEEIESDLETREKNFKIKKA